MKQTGEHQKRDTIMANAVNEFRTGQSELRGKMSTMESSFATIAQSLATLSQTQKRSRVVEESKSSDSKEEEERPRKRKWKKKAKTSANKPARAAAASSTQKEFTSGCTFHPDMKMKSEWDKTLNDKFFSARGNYAATHPQYKKVLNATKRARLQRALDVIADE